MVNPNEDGYRACVSIGLTAVAAAVLTKLDAEQLCFT